MLLILIFWNSEFATPQDSSVIFSVIVVISSLKHDVIPGYVLHKLCFNCELFATLSDDM